jgi:aspartate kinase
MRLLVQKYGGSSVATVDKIKKVAARIKKSVDQGFQVVVVVSAMGKTTNELVKLATDITATPSAREYDLLLSTGEQVSIALLTMALKEIGVSSVAMSAWHLGIRTDGNHRRARGKSIEAEPLFRELKQGRVIVAAGFQGISEEGHITTLGRGASDKTAVMLTAALKAERCEINTDVTGIFTADPRVVENAVKLKKIRYDEMLELATSGAKVMNPDSVELAKKFSVVLEVRHSFKEEVGSMITDYESIDDPVVVGAAFSTQDARITLHRIQASGGGINRLFRAIADGNINVDMILLTPSSQGFELSFTVAQDELSHAKDIVATLKGELDFSSMSHDADIAKISIVGMGMQNHQGVAARMFESLFRAGSQPTAVTTSEIKVSVLIEASKAEDALRAIHDEFSLGAIQDRVEG